MFGVGCSVSGVGCWGLEFGVWGLGVGGWWLNLGFGVWGLRSGVWGLGCGVKVWGLRLEFEVKGLGRAAVGDLDGEVVPVALEPFLSVASDHLFPSFGFRVLSLEFRVSSFGYRSRVPVLRFKAAGFRTAD